MDKKGPSPLANNNFDLNGLVNAVEKSLDQKEEINAVNVLQICLLMMKHVESFKLMSGKEKKNAVLNALRELIQRRGGAASLSMDIIPAFIDSVIQVDKGSISIHIDPTSCCAGLCSAVAAATSGGRRANR